MSKLYAITRCKEQIRTACRAIDTPFQAIKTLYQNRETTAITSSKNGEKERMLEIRFEGATLSFLFDNRNICRKVYLFPDAPNDVTHYLKYCSKTYQYNHIPEGWINNGCLIQVHIERNERSLMVLPVKPKFG